jgi:hypothetical protein
VVEMTRCTSLSPLGSEFDDFLFASIGKDQNGTLLSVVSALARLDVDPWQEAGELAQLPREAAIHRLATWIAALPDGPSAPSVHLDPGTIAGRLIALLPRQGRSNIASRQTPVGDGEATGSRAVSYAIVIIMVLMLCAQYIMASRQSQVQVDDPHSPTIGTVFPPTPPPNSGQ